MLPQRSGIQLAASLMLKKFEIRPVPLVRERVAWALTVALGKNPARASATMASACRNLASADLRFWFEMSICRSSPSSTGSV